MLTVLIPTFNRPRLLRRAVSSARMQLPQHSEILIIDDGSDEPAAVVLRDIISNDRRIRVLENQGEKGAAGARNFGVSHSAGMVILFLDDDDELKDGYVDHVLRLVSAGDARFGFSAIERCDKMGETTIVGKPFESGIIPHRAQLRHKIAGLGCGFWILKEVFLEIGGLNAIQKVDEDTDMCCRLLRSDYLPWYSDMVGVKVHVEHTEINKIGAQLTQNSANHTTSLCYLQTWNLHQEYFPRYSEPRWFLGARFIRRASKTGDFRLITDFLNTVRPVPMRFALTSYAFVKVLAFYIRKMKNR